MRMGNKLTLKREGLYKQPARIFNPNEEGLPVCNNRLFNNIRLQLELQYKREGIINYEDHIKQYDAGVVLQDGNYTIKTPININGLATEFSRLKNESDINEFAGKYGLLNIIENAHGNKKYGFSIFEPLQFWHENIKRVRRLLSLYRAIKKRHIAGDGDGIENLIHFPDHYTNGYRAHWMDDNESTLVGYYPEKNAAYVGYREITKNNTGDMNLTTAIAVLSYTIQAALEDGINIDFSGIYLTEKAPAGFRLGTVHVTYYLMAAIYYDIWRILTDDREVIDCEYCGIPIEKFGRRRTCSDACRQSLYRKNLEMKGEK